MAKNDPKETGGENTAVKENPPSGNGVSQPAPAQRAPIELDEAETVACYANFCRVNGTPEELIIDFGLNAHPFGGSAEKLRISQRLVVNYYTAKRMLAALQVAVQRHEAAFGVLETDVQKRVVPSALRQSKPPA